MFLQFQLWPWLKPKKSDSLNVAWGLASLQSAENPLHRSGFPRRSDGTTAIR
jgi:hypothetical protein